MHVLLRRTSALALAIALSGCGNPIESPKKDARSVTASKGKPVTGSSLSAGDYVASLEGMT
jgi:hypothetical protein